MNRDFSFILSLENFQGFQVGCLISLYMFENFIPSFFCEVDWPRTLGGFLPNFKVFMPELTEHQFEFSVLIFNFFS